MNESIDLETNELHFYLNMYNVQCAYIALNEQIYIFSYSSLTFLLIINLPLITVLYAVSGMKLISLIILQ